MGDNRPGVRTAYRVASEEARKDGRNAPTLEEVQARAPGLLESFIRYNLMREGKPLMADPPIKQGSSGCGYEPVYDTPVQLNPGEPPVIRTRCGTRPVFDVPYQDKSGRTLIQTRCGFKVVD